MSEPNLFHGPNVGYVRELYARYSEDPESVDAATRALFEAHAVEIPEETVAPLDAILQVPPEAAAI
jgi:2-oxoglutarate dehydrogenase E1 component